MPKLLSGAEIKAAIESESFLLGGDLASAEAVKYDFHMGDRVLKAAYRQPKDILSISEESRCVDPGEVVFVLSKERLRLPRNMTATLMPKRKLAHKGVHILGGLAVDPEYKGVLVIGLYNFSSTPFPLIPGMKLIAATFQLLAKNELSDYESADPKEVLDFPDELIALIQNYRPADMAALQNIVEDTRKDLASLKHDLTTDREWRQEFQGNLDRQNNLLDRTNTEINRVLELIREEAGERKTQDEKLSDRFNSMAGAFGGLKVGWLLAALLIGGLLSYTIPKVFGPLLSGTKPAPVVVAAPTTTTTTTTTAPSAAPPRAQPPPPK
jgi:deoxycytidine triphosphate deaminase